MTDREFDLLLEEELSSLSPNDDLVAEITPWRRAANRILTGTALCGITLNFLLLDHILPAIGLFLILLGFRSLRQENGWFRAGYVTATIRMAICIVNAIANATIWRMDLTWMTATGVLLTVFHALCTWGGFRAVQTKAGVERNSRGFWLVVYYVAIIVLGITQFRGTLVILALLVFYILLLRSLWKYAALLDDAGYAVQASPVRFSDRAVGIALTVILTMGIAWGYTFCNQYPMDWTQKEEISAEAAQVKADLLELGFPADILADLAEEDILSCRDAAKVHVSSQDYTCRTRTAPTATNMSTMFTHCASSKSLWRFPEIDGNSFSSIISSGWKSPASVAPTPSNSGRPTAVTAAGILPRNIPAGFSMTGTASPTLPPITL